MTPLPQDSTPQPGRVARKRQRRINEILRVAGGVLSEKGYYNTSLEEIADRLDLAKASLYHYFDSKESLLGACLEAEADEAVERLSAIAVGDAPATDRLRRLIIEELRIITIDFPELSRLFLTHLEWPATVQERIGHWHARHDAIFKRVIDEGVKAGELGDVDVSVVRHNLTGALNFVPFWFKPGGRWTDGQTFEAVADSVLLMFGVGPLPAPAGGEAGLSRGGGR
ncbi:MAG TPA: TetR/AcrR family transcriptional regulator [Acidimicrobiia bacterium]|nr:TetR/AcrR family transcriptional regulator [Acidimicrobiia bacterium]